MSLIKIAVYLISTYISNDYGCDYFSHNDKQGNSSFAYVTRSAKTTHFVFRVIVTNLTY